MTAGWSEETGTGTSRAGAITAAATRAVNGVTSQAAATAASGWGKVKKATAGGQTVNM